MKLSKITILMSMFLSLGGGGFCTEDDKHVLSFADIQERMPRYTALMDQARGKDITVFLGNTGSGKSTLINLLADIPMIVTMAGVVPQLDYSSQSAVVRGGYHSVTGVPQHFFSPTIGDLYDLPGFLDTEGVKSNILNAAAIDAILKAAKSVRILLLFEGSGTASRCHLLKRMDSFMKMLPQAYRQSTAFSIIINKADADYIIKEGHEYEDPDFEDIEKHLTVFNDVPLNRRLFLPRIKYRSGDAQGLTAKASLEKMHTQLHDLLRQMKGQSLEGAVQIYHTFPPESIHPIKKFFESLLKDKIDTEQSDCMKEAVKRVLAERPDSTPSQALEGQYGELWSDFKSHIKKMPQYILLSGVCSRYIHGVLDERIEPYFNFVYDRAVQNLVLSEKDEIIRKNLERMQEMKDEYDAISRDLKASVEKTAALDQNLRQLNEQYQALAKDKEASDEEVKKISSEISSVQQQLSSSIAHSKELKDDMIRQQENYSKLLETSKKEAEEYRIKAEERDKMMREEIEQQRKEFERLSKEQQDAHHKSLSEADERQRKAEEERVRQLTQQLENYKKRDQEFDQKMEQLRAQNQSSSIWANVTKVLAVGATAIFAPVAAPAVAAGAMAMK